ncbi:MAG: TetR/AcrR family transcriptional regulator [Proteobacteria bacterium]|nr:TetR/AcrR family transcriptional regulator [Pseudomonadota bacterium]
METQPFDSVTFKIVQRARDAFLREGYSRLTMTELADFCGLTRRGLYQHFKSKEDLLRATLRLQNAEGFTAAEWVVEKELARGGSALDVVAKWLDARFGNVRRQIVQSPYGAEINAKAFEVGNDIMIEISADTHARMAELIDTLCARKLLRLREGQSSADAAQLLADGARGVNQQRPAIPVSQLAPRYRHIAEAILYGCAETVRRD